MPGMLPERRPRQEIEQAIERLIEQYDAAYNDWLAARHSTAQEKRAAADAEPAAAEG